MLHAYVRQSADQGGGELAEPSGEQSRREEDSRRKTVIGDRSSELIMGQSSIGLLYNGEIGYDEKEEWDMMRRKNGRSEEVV